MAAFTVHEAREAVALLRLTTHLPWEVRCGLGNPTSYFVTLTLYSDQDFNQLIRSMQAIPFVEVPMEGEGKG